MNILNKLKYFLKSFNWMRVYSSPFLPPIPMFYFGEIVMGTPYFLPRRLVKDKDNIGRLKYTPKIIGFDFVSLGWKTKWTDYVFEWSPMWSFVFLKWQVAITFVAPKYNRYWECWLYYRYETDISKSVKERLVDSRKGHPCLWTTYSDGKKTTTCYWDLILKNKYKL